MLYTYAYSGKSLPMTFYNWDKFNIVLPPILSSNLLYTTTHILLIPNVLELQYYYIFFVLFYY